MKCFETSQKDSPEKGGNVVKSLGAGEGQLAAGWKNGEIPREIHSLSTKFDASLIYQKGISDRGWKQQKKLKNILDSRFQCGSGDNVRQRKLRNYLVSEKKV